MIEDDIMRRSACANGWLVDGDRRRHVVVRLYPTAVLRDQSPGLPAPAATAGLSGRGRQPWIHVA